MGYKATEWVWDNYHAQGSKKFLLLVGYTGGEA
jgi:hypothetical protein